MFSVLDIAKRTYYRYCNSQDKDYYDYVLIKEIFEESKRTYGYRRVCEGLLVKYGVTFNHKKVARIMKNIISSLNISRKLDQIITKELSLM